MRNFADFVIFSSLKVGFSLPGFTMGYDGLNIIYNAFVQNDPVLRLTVSDVSAASIELEMTATGGYYDSGDYFYSLLASKAVQGSVIYCPVGDAIAAAIKRPTVATTTPTAQNVVVSTSVRVLNSSGTVLSSASFDLHGYDSLCNYGAFADDWRLWGIPDTYRAMGGSMLNHIAIPCFAFGATQHVLARVKVGGATQVQNYNPDGTSLCWYTVSGDPLASFGYWDQNTPMHMARVEWVDCASDKILLEWWSPELGALKSQVADIIGSADAVTERNRETVGLDLVDGAEAAISYNVRFPLCTMADYLYFRDILFSNEVYILRRDNISYDEVKMTHRVAVRVSGNPPAWRIGDRKDFNFTVNIENTKQL